MGTSPKPSAEVGAWITAPTWDFIGSKRDCTKPIAAGGGGDL